MAIPDNSETDEARGSNNRPSRSGLTLNFGRHLPLSILTPSPSEQETIEEGEMLFRNFMSQEIQHAGLQQQYPQVTQTIPSSSNVQLRHTRRNQTIQSVRDHSEIDDDFEQIQSDYVLYNQSANVHNTSRSNDYSISTPMGYSNPTWARAGRDLRLIADEFASRPEREVVRERANQVDIRNINGEEFKELLNELFLDGKIRRERIVALFFFCSDVIIRALKERVTDLVETLFYWSVQFIADQVCAWIQLQGGWSAVLGTYVPPIAITVCAITLTVAAAIYIWKNW